MKLVKARAGAITLPKVVGMAFGNGGVEIDGTVIEPPDNQAALKMNYTENQLMAILFQKIRYAVMSARLQAMNLRERK